VVSFLRVLWQQCCILSSSLPCVLHVTLITFFFILWPKNIWWIVQIMKHLTVKFSLASSYSSSEIQMFWIWPDAGHHQPFICRNGTCNRTQATRNKVSVSIYDIKDRKIGWHDRTQRTVLHCARPQYPYISISTRFREIFQPASHVPPLPADLFHQQVNTFLLLSNNLIPCILTA
jgi:hypothetical protein